MILLLVTVGCSSDGPGPSRDERVAALRQAAERIDDDGQFDLDRLIQAAEQLCDMEDMTLTVAMNIDNGNGEISRASVVAWCPGRIEEYDAAVDSLSPG
ncbi:MAG: hypothetical protein KDB10_21100 [Acidimicrobiales bacterium]|nr:hypothetical protein [Acidimicrobiales bacterium]MCB9374003.1 hypothetical protein [Microthrixaceae bacterium]